MGWLIADWTADEPEERAPVMEHLRRLHADLSLGPFPTRVWRQTPSGLESLEFVIRHGSLKRFRGALERSSNQRNAAPLFPHKLFSLSECLLKLLFPGSGTAMLLGPDYRAKAHGAIMHQCIEPVILELESTHVTALERNRKLIVHPPAGRPPPRLSLSFARARKPEDEALLKQLTAEVSTLIDELDPPDQGAATKSSLKRRFTF